MGSPAVTDSRLGRQARNVSQLWKYLWRFARDARFRSKTIHFIENQTNIDGSTPAREQAARPAPPWLTGYRLYLVGGCELTYLKEWFEQRGAVVYHTFDHHRSSDPYSEVSDASSPLWTFEPDAIVLSPVQGSARLFDLLQTRGPELSFEEQQDGLDTTAAALRFSIETIRGKTSVPIVLMSQLLVHRPAFGVLEQSVLGDTLSLAEMKRRYDLDVYEVARSTPATYVLDVDSTLASEGFHSTLRGANELLGVHFTRRGGELVAERLERILWALDARSRRIKCAVFDLDGTLWTGVLREDGVDGVYVRRPFLGTMRHLAQRGILLAVCSKNDPAEAPLVAQLLGDALHSQVVSMDLSWEPKSIRLHQLASELGIGLDTLAFFDDNPRERAEVEMNAPEVLVLTDADVLEALSMPEFEPGPTLTTEAANRGSMYRTRIERSRHESSAIDPETFLRSLGLTVTLHRATGDEVPRVAELIARTNQMNATMRRSTLADIQQAAQPNSDGGVWVAYLEDKFGDYGLIGAIVTEADGPDLRLVELALSCRAMGRNVEHVLIAEVMRAAGESAAGRLLVDFRSTDRNGELRRILGEIGFEPLSSEGDVEGLALSPDVAVAVPEWITISTDA